MGYSRYTDKVDYRINGDAKAMLRKLSEAAQRPMSAIARDIMESAIRRRYSNLMAKKGEASIRLEG